MDLGGRELDPQLLAQLRDLQEWAARSQTEESSSREKAPAGDRPPEIQPAPLAVGAPSENATAAATPQAIVAYRDATPDLEPLRAAATAFEDLATEPLAPESRTPEEPAEPAAATTDRPPMRPAGVVEPGPTAPSASRQQPPVEPAAASPPAQQPGSPLRDQARSVPVAIAATGRRAAPRTLDLPSRRPGERPASRPSRWAAVLAALLLVASLAGYLRHAASRQPAAARSAAVVGQAPPQSEPRSATPVGGAEPSGPPDAIGLAARAPSVPPPFDAAAPPRSPRSSASPSSSASRFSSPSQSSSAPRSSSAPQSPPASRSSSASQSSSAPPSSRTVPPPRTSPSSRTSPAAKAKPLSRSASAVPASRHAGLLHPGPGVRPPVLITIPSLRTSGIAHRHHAVASLQLPDQRRPAADRIQLDVLVSDTGYVSRASLRRGDTSQIGLDRAALQAAMAARFRPATRYGVPGSMWTRLTFDFTN